MTAPRVAIRVESLELTDIRTYPRLKLAFESSLTVLVGANGVGKTNLLEAIAVVLSGASPRTSAELRLIREGAAGARIAARIEIAGDVHDREVVLELARGKSLRLDGVPVRGTDTFARRSPSLVFLPERLLIIRGAPARRRALIDGLAARVLPHAAAHLREYSRAVQQRNALLRRAKTGRLDLALLLPWDEQLVEHGQLVRADRAELAGLLAEPFARRFEALTQLPGAHIATDLRGGADIKAALIEGQPVDIRRGTTSAGPHLDELLPSVGLRDLRAFGSTGEQRSALLAFTLAARDVLADQAGVEPVILLDEPWSELDRDRRERLTKSLLEGGGQVVVTSTEPPDHLLKFQHDGASIAVLAVSSGAILPWQPTPPNSPTLPT